MRRVWTRGPRTEVIAKDGSRGEVTMKGKNGGPIVKQEVVVTLTPKESAC